MSVCLAASIAGTSTPASRSLPAVEVVAGGLADPVGVAVGRDGSIAVSDRKTGEIVQIDPSGNRTVLATGLDGPAGLAFDAQGGLLIVEERGRRVLRRDPSGALDVLASGIAGPRWIASAPDGTIYVTARLLPDSRRRSVNKRSVKQRSIKKRSAKKHGAETHSGKEHSIKQRSIERRSIRRRGAQRGSVNRGSTKQGRTDGPMRILALLASGEWRSIAGGFHTLEGLVWTDHGLYAVAEKRSMDRRQSRTWLVRVPIDANGAVGPIESASTGRDYAPIGIAVDRLGALFVTAEARGHGSSKKHNGVVLKPLTPASTATVLDGVREPRGLAFETTGDLLVVQGKKPGRLLRLRAPAPPELDAPVFTNQSPVAVAGRTSPGQRVSAFDTDTLRRPFAITPADTVTGTFSLLVPLRDNTDAWFAVTATANGGRGLSSAPAVRTITHDAMLPQAAIQKPPGGAHVRGVTTLRAYGNDGGSGLESLRLMLDDMTVATTQNPVPTSPLVGEFPIDTRSVNEGPHTFTVVATDRAGNLFADAQLVIVDRTPPQVRIVQGPANNGTDTAATFVVAGTDTYSSALDFSWRLDGEAWSTFAPPTTILVRGLAPGMHTFEARGRDMAGNESLNAAMQTFTVTSLQVSILEPAAGAVVTSPTVWLRGTYDGGSGVAVTVSLPPGSPIPSIPASAEAGIFAVEVPVDEATMSVTVNAVDLETGAMASDGVDIAVDARPTQSQPRLSALPAGGLAPHVVTFDLNLAAGTSIALDLDSDGTVDFEGTALNGLPFVYEQPGVYVPTLHATTSDGQVQTYRASVDVYDRAAFDARIQRVWRGLTESLRDGDLEQVLSFIHGARQAGWREYFEPFSPDDLEEHGAGFTGIELIRVGRGGAEYEMLREEAGQVFSYPVAFATDVDGQWRIWQF
jgi:sugar lactone lactonase YvrE